MRNYITFNPRKKTKIQNNGYIAKLSADKKTILNVYLDRKTAAKNNGYVCDSALDTPVKNFKISNGHYYALYDPCSDELKKEFVKKIIIKNLFYILQESGNSMINTSYCKNSFLNLNVVDYWVLVTNPLKNLLKKMFCTMASIINT